jgi:hypothetical protein
MQCNTHARGMHGKQELGKNGADYKKGGATIAEDDKHAD